MIVAGCVSAIGCRAKSLQNPALRRRSPAAAFIPQRPQLTLQPLQFCNTLCHVTDMGIQKGIDLTTVLIRCGAKSEQDPDFVQRHIQRTAMANER
jgi:hypothetical protein